jgi:hypothetical protein
MPEKNLTGNKLFYSILDCIGFWNTNGKKIQEDNIAGKYGSPRSQQEARECTLEMWLLNSILYDVESLIADREGKYKCGKGGSHVWISDNNNERLALITIN